MALTVKIYVDNDAMHSDDQGKYKMNPNKRYIISTRLIIIIQDRVDGLTEVDTV